jgi:hypothetical protein
VANDAPGTKSSQRTWSAECAIADSADVPEEDKGIAAVLAKQEVAYEFSGGRKFISKRNPYE